MTTPQANTNTKPPRRSHLPLTTLTGGRVTFAGSSTTCPGGTSASSTATATAATGVRCVIAALADVLGLFSLRACHHPLAFHPRRAVFGPSSSDRPPCCVVVGEAKTHAHTHTEHTHAHAHAQRTKTPTITPTELRPEFSKGSVDWLVGKDYCVRPPQVQI